MAAGAAPPATFASRSLSIRVEATGTRWRRLYASAHPNPLGFGLALSRFSDPTGAAFGVVYLGSSIKVAFAEVVLRDRGEGHVDPVPIPYAELEALICAEIEVAHDLRLIDLCGDAGVRMGVATDVVGARDQTLSRLWSEAFHEHPDTVDGVYYPSRLNEERNIALYDRALAKVLAVRTPALTDCRDALADIIRAFDLEIV